MDITFIKNIKFGKWFYKTIKAVVLGIIIVIILFLISILIFNEKIIAFINAFYH